MMYRDDLLDYSGWAIVGDFNCDANDQLIDEMTTLGNAERVNLSRSYTHKTGSTLDHVKIGFKTK